MLHIIVIGSGIAGLNFSLKAAQKGHKVTIVTKKAILESATNYAQGGIAATLDQTDNFQKHIEDTLKAGCFHNRKKAVALMVKNAPRLIHELVEYGVPFATLHGKLLLAKEGGHSERRIAFVGDFTGQEIERILVKKVKADKRIKILEHTLAVNLLVKKNVCHGVQIFSHGKLKNIFSDRVVLASGGLGQIYEKTTNPEISTGDGYAMGFRAGAKLRDMEFIQFHPTAFRMRSGRLFLLTEALRGEGAYLRNSKGIRFMKKIHPVAELAPRDIVSKAIFGGVVYLDLRHLDEEKIHARFPKITEMLRENGYRITKDLIPVFPAAHYCCGGIETDLKGQTNIQNLFCFGEVAWTGVHGANRLASNSLLEALVFSDQIAAMPQTVGKRPTLKKQKWLNLCFPKTKVIKLDPLLAKELLFLKTLLRKVMWEKVGIIRDTKGLQEAKIVVQEIHRQIAPLGEKFFHTKILELQNMLETSLLVIEAALKRKKSLGCHYRTH